MLYSVKKIDMLILFVALVFTGCNNNNQQTSSQPVLPPLRVDTVTVLKEKFPIWVEFTGTTKAANSQEIRTRVAGRLEKIYFEDGSSVQKGQKLFMIEQTQYINNLKVAKSRREQNVAALNLATNNVKRYKPLTKEGLSSQATFDQLNTQKETLIASIAADDAAIRNAQLELNYTVITAPISGNIGARTVDVGNLVGYGQSTLLATIVQSDKIYVQFSPTEDETQMIYKFRSRDRLPAFMEVRGKRENIFKRERLSGYVDFSDNVVDPLTSTVSMRATMDVADQSVYPGTFVYINVFVTDQFKFIMIPPQAVLEDQLGKFVYVVDGNNSAKRKDIQTSFDTRHYVGVRKGLENGDKVVVSGLLRVQEHSPLDPVDATSTKGVRAVLKANNMIPSQPLATEK